MLVLRNTFFSKGAYLRDLSFQGGYCVFFCPLMGQFHCFQYGPLDFPAFPLHVFVLSQHSMFRLTSGAKPVKLFACYQG